MIIRYQELNREEAEEELSSGKVLSSVFVSMKDECMDAVKI